MEAAREGGGACTTGALLTGAGLLTGDALRAPMFPSLRLISLPRFRRNKSSLRIVGPAGTMALGVADEGCAAGVFIAELGTAAVRLLPGVLGRAPASLPWWRMVPSGSSLSGVMLLIAPLRPFNTALSASSTSLVPRGPRWIISSSTNAFRPGPPVPVVGPRPTATTVGLPSSGCAGGRGTGSGCPPGKPRVLVTTTGVATHWFQPPGRQQ